MKLLLFDRNEKLIGTLKDIITAKHTEEINGENILEITTLDKKKEIKDKNLALNSNKPIILSDEEVIETTVEYYDEFERKDYPWGRNLLKGTNFLSRNNLDSNWIAPLNILKNDTYPYVRYSYDWYFQNINITLPAGEYIFSLMAKRDEEDVSTGAVRLYFNNFVGKGVSVSELLGLTTNSWMKYTHKFELTESSSNGAVRFLANGGSGYIRFSNIKLEKGSTATPWTPAPEDFNNLKGVKYNLSTTLKKDQWYTLSVKGDFVEDDFVGVWLGNDKFIGYLQGNKITFKANEDYEDKTIILKSLSEEGTIQSIQVEKGTEATNHELNKKEQEEIIEYQSIKKGYRIAYKDIYGYWHEFIIRGIDEVRGNEGIEKHLFCESSFYETLGDYVEDKRPYNTTANIALENALLTTRWEVGQIDNLGYNSTNFYHISAKEAVQKVAETWQGEIRTRITISGNKITGRYVDLLSKRGQDLGKRFSYTKDLESITRIVHRDDVITALYGFGKGEEVGEGFGRRIDFSDINDGKAYVENNDARLIWGRPDGHGGKAHVFGKVEFDDCEDPEELLQLTTAKLEELSKPLITYEAKVIDLNAYGLDHEGVELGDTVAVIDKEFTPELRLKARVVKIVRDLLEDENTITLGNFIPNIIDSTIEQETYINNFRGKQGVWDRARIIDDDGLDTQYLKGVIDVLKTKLTSTQSGWYTDDSGNLVFENNDKTAAMMLTGEGFMIASSKLPNGEYDWRTFGTGDGFVANHIITGLLQGGKVKFDLTNGTLLIGDSVEDYHLLFDGNSLKIKLSSGKTIEETIEDIDVDVGDIGTRNYLRDSNEDNSFTEEIATSPTEGNFDIIYPDGASIPSEDLNNFTNLNAIQYELTLPLEKDQVYTLSIYGDLEEDTIGVWLGNDKFIGYIINGVLVFTPLENYSDTEIQIKSLSEEGVITHAKLEKGRVLSDWSPAPEDYDNKANQDNVNELRSDVVKAGAELEKLSNLMQDQREELNNKLDRNDLVVDVYYGENIVSTKSSNWNDGKLIEKIKVRPNSRMVVYSEIGNGQPEATRCMFTFYDENNNILRSTVLKSSTEEDISDYPYSFLTPIGNEVYLGIEFLNAMPSETDLRNGRFKVEYGREATEFTLALNDINGDHLEQGQVNSTTEPESPIAGLVWWNPSNLELNKYDGMDWNLVGWMTQQDLRDKIIANETSLEVLNDSVILEISKIREDQEKMTTHFNFTEEGLEIGKTDDPFDIRLSNKRLDFNKDNVPIAWISSEEENLYIKNAQITEKMIMGVHMIEKYSDGVTYIRYIGQAVDTPPGEIVDMNYYDEGGEYVHYVFLDDSESPLGRGNPDGFIFAHYKMEGMENPGEPWITIAEGTVNSPPGQDIKAPIWYNMGMIGAYGRMRITWTLTFEKFTDITLTATKTYWSFF